MDKEVQGDVTADKESNKCNVSPETSSNESELATSSHVPPTTATITAQRSEQRHESSTSCENGMEGDSVSVSSQPLTSTPLRGDVNVDTGRERVRFDVDSVSVSDSVSRDSVSSRESLVPEQISVPIQGFEIMEERAKFTVFKIKVEKSESDSWFVFRRYTDFVQLNEKLRRKFPKVRLSLPPKRWFKDNFDKDFIEDRVLGLQAFINNCIGHKDICNSRPVREFFCFDEPPGPHDSLEESRALCDNLEESVYRLRKEVSEKDTEISLLREELELYKRQVEMLSQALRDKNAGIRSLESPASVGDTSLTSDDLATCPEADQSQVQANMVNNSGHTEEKYCNGELDKKCSDSKAKDKSPVASEINSKQSKKKFSIFHSKGGKSQVAAVNS